MYQTGTPAYESLTLSSEVYGLAFPSLSLSLSLRFASQVTAPHTAQCIASAVYAPAAVDETATKWGDCGEHARATTHIRVGRRTARSPDYERLSD